MGPMGCQHRTGLAIEFFAILAVMSRANPHVLLVIAIAVAAVVFLDPFGFRRTETRLERTVVSEELLATLRQHLEQYHQDPLEYVSELFETRRVVFLGEYGRIREQAEFVAETLEPLHAAGVHHLGVVHLLSADQAEIDELITAEHFDRAQAERLLFNRKVLWGYHEYVDLLEAVWRLNRDRSAGETQLRVVGLSVQPEYHHLHGPPDLHDPAKMQQVFAAGLPDRAIADAIERKITDPGHKALVFTPLEHGFTRYEDRAYSARIASLGFAETGRAGNYVYDHIGEQAATVMLHSPWPDHESSAGAADPAGGVLETLIAELSQDRRRTALDLGSGPFGELEIPAGAYRNGYADLTLGELADGYILLGSIGEYTTARPIRDFITASTLEEAVRRFPGPTPEGATVSGMNAYLERINDQVERTLDLFR